MNNGTIYLCGPISNRTDEQCVLWRNVVTEEWKGKTLNPLRRDYRGRELENPAQLVHDDLHDIRESDGLIVWYDAPSIGTSMEIFYAKHALNLPIVVVDVRMDKGGPLSPWLVNHVDLVTTNGSEALTVLAKLIAKNRRLV